ncbi:methyltransferase domain-containing protein [Paraburkholderia sp. PGU19]|uniref:SAM-dependent methyltransferase n=1 Tax=Paraburkholderia sp. PGU19 TaxID=2735434 RepID=UPI001FB174CC|nr:methyltransferase domain-containing protein [Paraburkholderia sp. PGU19]
MSKAPSLQLDSATLADEYDRLGIRQFNHGLQLLDALDLRERERVLDIGCGTGRLTESAAQRVGAHGEVLGIATARRRRCRMRRRTRESR